MKSCSTTWQAPRAERFISPTNPPRLMTFWTFWKKKSLLVSAPLTSLPDHSQTATLQNQTATRRAPVGTERSTDMRPGPEALVDGGQWGLQKVLRVLQGVNVEPRLPAWNGFRCRRTGLQLSVASKAT